MNHNHPVLGAARLRSVGEVPTASMNEVVMKKAKLLEFLIENKAKHDVILANAIVGYWEIASNKLAAKKTTLFSQVDEFKTACENEIAKINGKIERKEKLPDVINFSAIRLDAGLGLVYPEDHSRDYDRAISMMENSIYEDVRLSVDEYDAYVLNNWEWKTNFLANNAVYFNAAKTSNKLVKSTGVFGPQGPNGQQGRVGSYAAQYEKAADSAYTFMLSGSTAQF